MLRELYLTVMHRVERHRREVGFFWIFVEGGFRIFFGFFFENLMLFLERFWEGVVEVFFEKTLKINFHFQISPKAYDQYGYPVHAAPQYKGYPPPEAVKGGKQQVPAGKGVRGLLFGVFQKEKFTF